MKPIIILILAALAAACSPMHYTRGVPNLAQVDANVWRSGQITTQEGWDYIKELAAGRTVHVIKLNFPNDGSDGLAKAMGFEVIELPIQPEGDQNVWDDIAGTIVRPSQYLVGMAEVVLYYASFLVDTDFFLVHCTHGQDRTGLIIGEHRVLHDGWSERRAYGEMLEHHFHWELVGLQRAWLAFANGDE